jgi:hypothetical protein
VSEQQHWGTHGVEFVGERVVKRFRSDHRAKGAREWEALTLLDRHAPGLAPAPLEAHLDTDAPVVTMSRLPGTPLRGQRLDAGQVGELAAAVRTVQESVPPQELGEVPARLDGPAALVEYVRARLPRARPRVGAHVRAAMDAGARWLETEGERRLLTTDVPPVFGCGDGNLANYLWDGTRVRIVDFEDSGRSDRVFELAEITEHAGSWVEYPLDVPAFLGHFVLSPVESARLPDCRRLLALVWLFLLASDDPDNPRNPPGTADRQAERVAALLG